MVDFDRLREEMVDRQIARRGVRCPAVLRAMRAVPREYFVPEAMQAFAYQDMPLPIGEGQSISQPFIVAVMIEAAGIGPGSRVLEVGAGSGYAAAVMSRIAARVFAVERLESLAQAARARLAALGYDNVDVHVGDGTRGLAEEAPFDAILVAASGPDVPPALREQLCIGGHLVIPVGRPGNQRLCRVTRLGPERFDRSMLGGVSFVPLIGEQGWQEDEQSLP